MFELLFGFGKLLAQILHFVFFSLLALFGQSVNLNFQIVRLKILSSEGCLVTLMVQKALSASSWSISCADCFGLAGAVSWTGAFFCYLKWTCFLELIFNLLNIFNSFIHSLTEVVLIWVDSLTSFLTCIP